MHAAQTDIDQFLFFDRLHEAQHVPPQVRIQAPQAQMTALSRRHDRYATTQNEKARQ